MKWKHDQKLSLSPFTIRNFNSFGMNQSQAIEWLVRPYLAGELPASAPYIVINGSGKIVVNVNISPYTIGILKDFGTFGMNPYR